jgi:hypothetical protein
MPFAGRCEYFCTARERDQAGGTALRFVQSGDRDEVRCHIPSDCFDSFFMASPRKHHLYRAWQREWRSDRAFALEEAGGVKLDQWPQTRLEKHKARHEF